MEDGTADMQQHSLIYEVYPVIVAELFSNPILQMMDLHENFKKHIVAPRARDQEEMNACFSGTRFWLAERYTVSSVCEWFGYIHAGCTSAYTDSSFFVRTPIESFLSHYIFHQYYQKPFC